MTTTTSTSATSAVAILDAIARLEISAMTAAYLEAEVTAARPGGAAYRVRLGPRGAWACSCPAAIYSGRRGHPCKPRCGAAAGGWITA